MKTSEKLDELAGALAKAQAKFPTVFRNRVVTIQMKNNRTYQFSYATFDAIIDAVRAPLAENGLSFVQGVDGSGNGTVVETLLLHSSGQSIATTTPISIGSGADLKDTGAGISYGKRYALQAILGIATDDEDDSGGATDDEIVQRDTRAWHGPMPKTHLDAAVKRLYDELAEIKDEYQWKEFTEDTLKNKATGAEIATYAGIVSQYALDCPDRYSGTTSLEGDGFKPLRSAILEAAKSVGREKDAGLWLEELEP